MPRQKPWPSHGTAVNARDEAAEILNEIEKQAAQMFELASKNKLNPEDALALLGRMIRLANHGLRLLEEQGAPTKPFVRLDWSR